MFGVLPEDNSGILAGSQKAVIIIYNSFDDFNFVDAACGVANITCWIGVMTPNETDQRCYLRCGRGVDNLPPRLSSPLASFIFSSR